MSSSVVIMEHAAIEEVEMDSTFQILLPDHPLMVRFQTSLKCVLSDLLKRLTADTLQLEEELHDLKKQKFEISDTTCNAQAKLQKQEILINNFHRSLCGVIHMNEEVESHLKNSKSCAEEEKLRVADAIKQNTDLQQKLDFENFVLYSLRKIVENQDSNLLISQQIAEKNKHDKREFCNEINVQDIMLLKSENRVIKLKSAVEEMKNRIITNRVELDCNSKILSEKSADAALMSQENSQLFRLWQSVITAIEQRDSIHSKNKSELTYLESYHTATKLELNKCKISVEDAITKNEILCSQKDAKEMHLTTLIQDYMKIKREKNDLEQGPNMLILIETTNKQLNLILLEKIDYASKLTTVNAVIKNFQRENDLIEESLLSQLQEQVISNNGTLRVNSDIGRINKIIKKYEHSKEELNLKLTDVSFCIDNIQRDLNDSMEYLRIIKKDINDEKMLNKEFEYELCRTMANTEQKNILLEKQILYLESIKNKIILASPIEEQIRQIYEDICCTAGKIQELKVKWLREQNQIIKLMKEKSEQINQFDLVQKQMYVLQYKKFKLNNILRQQHEYDTIVGREYSSLLQKITKLNQTYGEKKGYKNTLDNEHCNLHNEYVQILKKFENDMLLLVSEINNIEEDKENLYGKLVSVQREDLDWEKKVKLANDMRQNVYTEDSQNGEIGNMKIEIHHMEIRYSQLKKAQEKLSSDLQMCALKRQNIVSSVFSKQEIHKSKKYYRQIFTRQHNSLKNKISELKLELKNGECAYDALKRNITVLNASIENINNEKVHSLESVNDLDCLLRDISLQKQTNLDALVYNQRKTSYITQAKMNSYIMLHKSTSAVEAEYLKQSCLNNDLTSISEAVYNDFPQYADYVSRVLHLLNLE